jgi:hypothetical protein
MPILICLLIIHIVLILILLRLYKKRRKTFFIRVLEEYNNMLKFVLVLPEKAAVDVVSRELKVSVGDGTESIIVLNGDDTQSSNLLGNHNDKVAGSLVDVDVNGNRSPESLFDLVLVDNIAPPMPGQVGISVLEDNVQPEPQPEE